MLNDEVRIKSADTAATLAFSAKDGDYFIASYESPALRASIRVYGYTDCEALVELFESMSRDWKGWEGERNWVSLEGEFGFSCTSDGKGHVALKLGFAQMYDPEPWRAQSTLNLEAGLLDSVATSVRKFFFG